MLTNKVRHLDKSESNAGDHSRSDICIRVSNTTIKRTEMIDLLMPISIEEFMRGRVIDGSSKIILEFLRSHRDQAFTQDEIIKAVNPIQLQRVSSTS